MINIYFIKVKKFINIEKIIFSSNLISTLTEGEYVQDFITRFKKKSIVNLQNYLLKQKTDFTEILENLIKVNKFIRNNDIHF